MEAADIIKRTDRNQNIHDVNNLIGKHGLRAHLEELASVSPCMSIN